MKKPCYSWSQYSSWFAMLGVSLSQNNNLLWTLCVHYVKRLYQSVIECQGYWSVACGNFAPGGLYHCTPDCCLTFCLYHVEQVNVIGVMCYWVLSAGGQKDTNGSRVPVCLSVVLPLCSDSPVCFVVFWRSPRFGALIRSRGGAWQLGDECDRPWWYKTGVWSVSYTAARYSGAAENYTVSEYCQIAWFLSFDWTSVASLQRV